MYAIRKQGGMWQVTCGGQVVYEDPSQVAALAYLAGALQAGSGVDAQPDAGDTDPADPTLLAVGWVCDPVIEREDALALDSRDFTDAQWTWRDPAVSVLPALLATTTSAMGGHDGAELFGFVTSIGLNADGNPAARGRFYATETGREARDMLANDKRFGVSADGGPNSDYEFVCTEEDEYGCIAGKTKFTIYEVAGLTMVGIPRMAGATIRLDEASPEVLPDSRAPISVDDGITDPAQPIIAAAPIRPTGAWFVEPNEDLGAYPLTCELVGQVHGYVAAFGVCYLGSPDDCITAPTSATGYSHFLSSTPRLELDDGTKLRTGPLVMSTDHAALHLGIVASRDHYANTGCAFADVIVGENVHGIWIAGALRPEITEAQIRALNGSHLSGDWRFDDAVRNLELTAVLAVNTPGFPIVASARPTPLLGSRMRFRVEHQVQRALVASAVVRRHTGELRPGVPCGGGVDAARMDRLENVLSMIERRTRPLAAQAGQAALERLRKLTGV